MDPDVAKRIFALERRMRTVEEQLGIDPNAADPEDEVVDLIARGRRIEAIKAYQDSYRVGLKEAKAAIERMEQLHQGLPSD